MNGSSECWCVVGNAECSQGILVCSRECWRVAVNAGV